MVSRQPWSQVAEAFSKRLSNTRQVSEALGAFPWNPWPVEDGQHLQGAPRTLENQRCVRASPIWEVIVQAIAYLQHDHAYLLHTLDDGIGGAWYSHCTLCRVWQHVPRHLHLGSCGLEQRQKPNRASLSGRQQHLANCWGLMWWRGGTFKLCLFLLNARKRACVNTHPDTVIGVWQSTGLAVQANLQRNPSQKDSIAVKEANYDLHFRTNLLTLSKTENCSADKKRKKWNKILFKNNNNNNIRKNLLEQKICKQAADIWLLNPLMADLFLWMKFGTALFFRIS